MLCIDAYRINYVYQKTELQGDIAYLWENEITCQKNVKVNIYIKHN